MVLSGECCKLSMREKCTRLRYVRIKIDNQTGREVHKISENVEGHYQVNKLKRPQGLEWSSSHMLVLLP